MRKIAVYVRVSTKRQETRSQEPDLERWIAAYAGSAPVEWFRDKATGRTMDRPGWKRLDAEINAGGVETIVVWRLDRLGRTAAGLTALFEKLTSRKVGLVSVRDGLDLATPAGRLVANMLASVAAFENEIRAERILAGQEAARARGKSWGGSLKGRRLKVTDEQVATIHRLRAERTPVAAIARTVGLTRPTVYSLLKNA